MVHAIHPMILVVTQSRTLATILAAILATISASHHLECLSLALIQHSFFSSTIVELAWPNLVLRLGLVLQDLFPRKVDLILLNNPIWMTCCTLSCTLNVYARCFAKMLSLCQFRILILDRLAVCIFPAPREGDLCMRRFDMVITIFH